ncbi:zinc finger protein 93-like [Oppia nitens]|uniref:zinc finger protein 93-like n=1 Tax=Oppia nitens TaxID=1686743 RepID=UPI0023DC25CE|nr:zinc finger protein 93-like [Oppia nitens]
MCEIVVNDLFDEIINENNRLCNQLVFAMKCLDVLQTFETFIRKVMTFKTIIINEQQLSSQDIQTLDQLDNQLTDVLTQLKQRSVRNVKSYEKQLISGKADQMSGEELVNKSRVNINNQLTVSPKVISIKVLKLQTINDSIKSKQQSDENERQTQKLTDNSHEMPFPCYVINCDYKSCDIPGLISHLKTSHSITSIQCTHEGCTQLFGDQHDLNRHLQLKHKTINKNVKKSIDKITNKSQIIRKSQKINRLVTNQMNINNTDNEVKTQLDCIKKKFNCFVENCYYNCLNVNELVNHLKIRHSITNYIQCTCDGCQQLFVDEKQLKSHVSDEHKIYDSSLIVIPNDCNKRQKSKTINPFDCKQLFKCDYKDCGEMFKTYFQFDKHMKCHPIDESVSQDCVVKTTKTDVFECLDCNLKFKTDWELDLHTNVIHKKLYSIKCHIEGCDKLFDATVNQRFSQYYKRHVLTHFNSNPFKCDYEGCDKQYLCRSSFYKHRRSHTNPIVTCDWPGCDFRTPFNYILKYHQNNKHLKDRPQLKCHLDGCTYSTLSKGCLRSHIRYRHGNKKFMCDHNDCQKSYKTIFDLNLHKSRFHNNNINNSTYRCSWPGCVFETKYKPYLSQHQLIHSDEKNYRCEHPGCQFRAKQQKSIISHRKSHQTGKNYMCSWPECGRLYKSDYSLRVHMQYHRNTNYVCQWAGCSYRTHIKSNLKTHINIKHEKLRYCCDYEGCDRVFKAKCTLRYHKLSVHEKQSTDKYQCSWPGCEYSTWNLRALNSHELIHSSVRKYRCDYNGCEFATNQKNYLNSHQKRHSTELKYRCSWPDCHKRYKSQEVLKSHEVIHSEPKYVCHWEDFIQT